MRFERGLPSWVAPLTFVLTSGHNNGLVRLEPNHTGGENEVF